MQDEFSFLNNVRENDLPSMIEWYRNASAAGDVLSIYYLGMCYEHGRGVEQSIKEACLLYSRAAEGGNADAMYAIGRLIESGKVSLTRDGDALTWYKHAAALGHKGAIEKVKSDISEIVKNVGTSEADPDIDPDKLYEAGMSVLGGDHPKPSGDKSLLKAAMLFSQAAEGGCVPAMYELATFYEKGIVLTQSYEVAAIWYRRAGDNDHPAAETALGRLYENGLGVERSDSEAYRWYHRAAGHFEPEAMFRVGVMTEEGRGTKQDYTDEQARIAKGDEEPLEKARALERLDLKFHEKYMECVEKNKLKDLHETPPKSLDIPGWFQQVKIYFKRDFLAKISNTQYLVLNILEAPALGLILSFLIRYIADPNSSVYIFYENANIPIYIFMSLIVAMFLGLMVSGEEIFKDQKILNREKFLNLSRSTYLVAKISILFIISAIQSILFVLVANSILSVRGLWFEYWWAMFTIATFSNLVGLILSSTFNSAVTIYIMIPLVMIPQMALGGAMFSFDKLNRAIGSIEGVPPICEFIATRWVYEGLMVRQFKDNEFEKKFYDIHQQISEGSYKATHYIPQLIDRIDYCSSTKLQDLETQEDIEDYKWKLALLKNELSREMVRVPDIEFDFIDYLTVENFTPEVGLNTKEYIEKLRKYYENITNEANNKRNAIINYWDDKNPGSYNRLREAYENEAVNEIVKNVYAKTNVNSYRDHLIQIKDPVFEMPWVRNIFDYRAQFYSPKKFFLGHKFDTFWFNMWVVWLMTALCYVALYYDWLKRSMDFFPEVAHNVMKKIYGLVGQFAKKKDKTADKKDDN